MAVTVTHRFISGKSNSSDLTLVNPSNWNDTHVVTQTNQFIVSNDYIFTPQIPGNSLTGGITNVVTLSPVPIGVSGSDINHYLYISGGTGIAEAVRITGGTAISGATSGTIIFVPANNHGGAWTIQSATAGVQEAHNSGVGIIHILQGVYDWYGSFWSNGNITIIGAGQQATIINFRSTTLKMFDIERDCFVLEKLTLQQVGTPVSGNIGIFTAGPGSGISGAVCSNGFLQDVNIFGFYNGIYTHGGTSTFNLLRINVNACLQDGVTNRATQGFWQIIVCVSNQGNGITYMTQAVPGAGGGPTFMSGLETYNNKGWGFWSNTGVQISGTPSFFNNDYMGEIYVGGAPIIAGWIADVNIQFAGHSISWGDNNTAQGILVDTSTGAIAISNIQIFNTNGNSILSNSPGISVTNSILLGPGVGGDLANRHAISGSNMLITGNSIGGPIQLGGNNNIITGNNITYNGTLPVLRIVTGANNIIADNIITQAGSGAALVLDSGVLYQTGSNIIVGSITNNGARSGNSITLS